MYNDIEFCNHRNVTVHKKFFCFLDFFFRIQNGSDDYTFPSAMRQTMSYKYPNVSLLGYLVLEPLLHMQLNPKNNVCFFDIDILKQRI